jgi:hypothetical protein
MARKIERRASRLALTGGHGFARSPSAILRREMPEPGEGADDPAIAVSDCPPPAE